MNAEGDTALPIKQATLKIDRMDVTGHKTIITNS